MNVGANYMREHIKDSSRIHYVITNGGGQPNVVPATAQSWYYVRANDHNDLEKHFDWLKDIGETLARFQSGLTTASIGCAGAIQTNSAVRRKPQPEAASEQSATAFALW